MSTKKILQEKAELELKIQRLKKVADQNTKELYDALHRAERLARSLGFDNVYDAQIFIDSVDQDVPFKECLTRVQMLQAELVCEKKEVELLQTRLDKAEDGSSKLREELEKCKTELHASKRVHQERYKQLEERYDTLKAVKERAAERFKADFKKWREFCKWLFAENDEHQKHRNEPGISKEEKKRRDLASVMRKRQKMIEIGPDLARFPEEDQDWTTPRPPIGRTEPLDEDKENDGISSPLGKEHRHVPTAGSPLHPLKDIQLKSVTNFDLPSLSPTVFLVAGATTTTPNPSRVTTNPGKLQITPIQLNTPKRALLHMPSSSDTEDDSQAVALPSTNPRSGKPSVFKVPAPPPTSSSSRQPLAASPVQVSRRPLDFVPVELGGDGERPLKVRKLSGGEFALRSDALITEETTPLALKSKKKHDQISTTTTRPDDYSAFKGRGRYGGQSNNEKPINALFMIDPIHNGGKNFQYDQVVRSKDERRKMHAGDCECCREYYENVGPLPNRLQQPLWRSPSKTPSRLNRQSAAADSSRGYSEPNVRHHHRRRRGGGGEADDDIDAHRQAISRHRHTWARPKTPPAYWEIGFPNTQEVGDINAKAKEMQQKKVKEIEIEASRDGGRYRRK